MASSCKDFPRPQADGPHNGTDNERRTDDRLIGRYRWPVDVIEKGAKADSCPTAKFKPIQQLFERDFFVVKLQRMGALFQHCSESAMVPCIAQMGTANLEGRIGARTKMRVCVPANAHPPHVELRRSYPRVVAVAIDFYQQVTMDRIRSTNTRQIPLKSLRDAIAMPTTRPLLSITGPPHRFGVNGMSVSNTLGKPHQRVLDLGP